MAATRVQLCGRITVELEGRRLEAGLPGRQGRLLFVFLALNRMRVVSRDELAAAIWPDQAPAAADANLNVIVSRLRRLLGSEALGGRGEVRLVLPPDAVVDVEVAARKIHEAEAAVHVEDWPRAVAAGTIACHIAARGFLSSEDAPWVGERRRWLEEVYLRALECDAAGCLGLGGSEVAQAEAEARKLVLLAPYRETGHRLLMQALARRGDGAEALVVYDELRTRLREELGTTPSPATRELHRRILDDD